MGMMRGFDYPPFPPMLICLIFLEKVAASSAQSSYSVVRSDHENGKKSSSFFVYLSLTFFSDFAARSDWQRNGFYGGKNI